MRQTGRNVSASVHARLLARAQQRREDFNLTLKRYVAERFLYRLGASPHQQRFVLKGAMLLPLWGGDLYRATRDLDLTGYAGGDAETLVGMMREICAVPDPDDGLEFRPASVRAEPIRDGGEYHGFRVKLEARLGNARLGLQVDVGFGDAVEPPATEEEYPTLLEGPAPRIRAYPREAVIAEKLHAMITLGAINTRFKDFYDVFVLSQHFSFRGGILARAVAATFERRRTVWPEAQPIALGPAFYSDPGRGENWQRYLDRSALSGAPADFPLVGERIQMFLGSPSSALSDGGGFDGIWPAGGPWKLTGPEQGDFNG